MIYTQNTKVLKNSFIPLFRLISAKEQIPQGILIDATEHGTILTAMNSAVRASIKLPFNVLSDEPGRIVVPNRFAELLQTLPDCDLTITVEHDANKNEMLIAKWQNGKSAIPSTSTNDIDTYLPRIEFEQKDINDASSNILISSPEEFMDAIISANNTVSEAGEMKITEYILIESQADTIHVVGTDSHELYHTVIEPKGQINGGTVLIPQSAALAIKSMFDKDGENVIIKKGKSKTSIYQGNIEICLGNIDRKYPAWKTVFPNVHVAELTFDRKTLLESICRLNVFAPENAKIEFNITPEHIEASSQNVAYGMSARETIPYKGEIQENLKISLSGKYLIQILKIYKDEGIKIKFGGKNKPLTISPENEKEKPEFLIMPLLSA